jgi:hypothetical protein
LIYVDHDTRYPISTDLPSVSPVDTTEDGSGWLRPNGNSGPAAISLGALEEYFHVQGREWERFAWLKSRVVAPVDGWPAALRAPALGRVVLCVPALPRLQRV